MKAKTAQQLKRQLQPLFNKFIRQRDSEDGYFTCISCSGTLPVDEMNAGHFYPTKGYDGLRFDEDNCHGECQKCNGFDPMHLLGYEKNLIAKITVLGYAELQFRASEYKKHGHKWSRITLGEMIEYYKQKIKELI